MKTKLATTCFVVATILAFPTPLSAHHAARLFEVTTPIWVKGTVVQFNWGSPHTAIIVEQVADDGTKVRWALENSGRLDMLESMGYTRDSFQPGDSIEACGFAPKGQYAPALSRANPDTARPGPKWLEGSERVITARLLLTGNGPEVDWSHYGPLELCISEDELRQLAR
jgi:hypothetical protein